METIKNEPIRVESYLEMIQKIENEVKDLHFNPQKSKEGKTLEETKEIFTEFWNYHMKVVIAKSREMAKKYKADAEVVWLASIFHDIARLDEAEPHDEIGAEKAYELLKSKGYSEETAGKVRDVIFTHRCKQHKPENLEQKILATADAMSHFSTPFYLWVARGSKKDMAEMLESNMAKIERDYNDKILFDDEKQEIQKEYEVLKKWCGYKA